MARFPFVVLLLIASWGAALRCPAAPPTVDRLRCEQLQDPEGVDAPRPRLSWTLASGQRGERQVAYQLQVASTAEGLASGAADLWDSGRVESGESVLVPYAGAPLGSHQGCHWRVRVWGAEGGPSPWSRGARWSMGLLKPDDWSGQWIGIPVPKQVEQLQDTQWVWFPEGDPRAAAPVGERWFRKAFEIPAGRPIVSATLRITADDHVSIFLNGRDVGSRSGWQSAKELDVTHRLTPGMNLIGARARNEGTAPTPAGLIARLTVRFESGDPLDVPTDATWRASNQAATGWELPGFDDSAWVAAKVLAPAGAEPWGPVRHAESRRLAERRLRKELVVDKPIRRAIVSYAGLGSSELYINGQRIGDAVLSPAVSQYPVRAHYVTQDVTGQLQQGANCVGVLLGNGRFYAPRSEVYAGMPTFGSPMLMLRLDVTHVDGSTTRLVSDTSWRLTDQGPIVANNEYDGEEYDARRELPGWDSAGYDDSGWRPAERLEAPSKTLSSAMSPPIRVTESVKPVGLNEVRPGVWVYDLGQNIVGWCRIKVNGPAGARVRLRHAETLNADGTLYVANLRGARATDVYTLKGTGPEAWAPRFTYHGFRYVEVTGFPGTPTLDDLTGEVVHDDLPSAGEFASSNELLNRVHRNVVWGVRGNYRSMPTDCPQRDERQGWLGDRLEVARGESYLFDNAAFYAKWLRDIRDSQLPTGSLPDVAPAHWPLYTDNVVWPSASVVIPGMLRDQFGDTAPVADQYECNARWVTLMLSMLRDGLSDRDKYGDWCVPPEAPRLIHSKDPARATDPTLLASMMLFHDLRVMAGYARTLGRADDADRYAAAAQELRGAINARFYDAERGQYANGAQTTSAMPLAFGLPATKADREKVFARLVRSFDDTSGHIATGLVGGQYLCRALTDGGRADLALAMATKTDYPGWGYMIGQGATTVWELWNGNTADPAMNSGNHVMLVGDLVTWLYEDLAGIAPAEPGFRVVEMRPQVVAGLDWVRARHESPYGTIVSHWRRTPGATEWDVTVPPGATARVLLPPGDAASATESGRPLTDAEGVTTSGVEGERAAATLASGVYRFRVPAAMP